MAITQNITIDTTAPFCAARFYQALHAWGHRPYATEWEGSLGEGALIDASDRFESIVEWAHRGDPNREARRAYVTSVWANRPDPAVQFVELGAGQ
jgi:hypothetical protein